LPQSSFYDNKQGARALKLLGIKTNPAHSAKIIERKARSFDTVQNRSVSIIPPVVVKATGGPFYMKRQNSFP
jgi:hypothetical protein